MALEESMRPQPLKGPYFALQLSVVVGCAMLRWLGGVDGLYLLVGGGFALARVRKRLRDAISTYSSSSSCCCSCDTVTHLVAGCCKNGGVKSKKRQQQRQQTTSLVAPWSWAAVFFMSLACFVPLLGAWDLAIDRAPEAWLLVGAVAAEPLFLLGVLTWRQHCEDGAPTKCGGGPKQILLNFSRGCLWVGPTAQVAVVVSQMLFIPLAVICAALLGGMPGDSAKDSRYEFTLHEVQTGAPFMALFVYLGSALFAAAAEEAVKYYVLDRALPGATDKRNLAIRALAVGVGVSCMKSTLALVGMGIGGTGLTAHLVATSLRALLPVDAICATVPLVFSPADSRSKPQGLAATMAPSIITRTALIMLQRESLLLY